MIVRKFLFIVALITSLFANPSSPLPADEAETRATPVTSITAPTGFRVELLRSAKSGEGSWISMTFDDRGRLILGRDNVGVARLTLAGNPKEIRYETIENSLKHCRGVLYAHNSLYVCATNSKGFYRLRDTTGDDRFDKVELLKAMDYRSRYGHGNNQVVLGPDDMIYIVNGNDVSFPDGTSQQSPYRDPRNDHLLRGQHDAGHDNRVGHILKTDAEGKSWEVVAGGFRNQFDLAFNADGEMFTFDADMEWDVGLPWYRPTRVNHIVSGGEYGWRWGTGKWPVYYADSLPSTLDCGLGSPTALTFGYDSKFPARYRDALFMADWQNGRILLVDLVARGASYSARYEVFLEGAPLNVCDMQFGPDGALYFITGGRGSQAGLYRVTWVSGTAEPKRAIDPKPDPRARDVRELRRKLETWHSRRDPEAVDFAWPYLNSEDRWLRFAARIAIENQALTLWRARALAETRATAAITALVALARKGRPSDRQSVQAALDRIELAELPSWQLAELLRGYQLCIIRLGKPDERRARQLAERLAAHFPNAAPSVNHLLCELLVDLNYADAVPKTVALLSSSATQEEQIRYAQLLTHARQGWSLESRRAMLSWLQRAKTFRGGRLLPAAIANIQSDCLATLSEDEHKQLAAEIAALKKPSLDAGPTVARRIVQQWTIDDLLPLLKTTSGKRSYENARHALLAASCLKCHRIGDSGGQVGPDLTNLGKRFDDRAILESILSPSKVIDPKYRHMTYELASGKIITGRPEQVSRTHIVVLTDEMNQASVKVARGDIEKVYPAQLSPMPTGLMDVLEKEEILDLLALLKAGGDPNTSAFK